MVWICAPECFRHDNFVINRLFVKLFHTNIMDTVKFCQDQFGFELPSVLIAKSRDKFLAGYKQFALISDLSLLS